MLELERLLKFTPDEAILMMANKEMNTYLRPEIATVGPITPIEGSRTKVQIRSRNVQPNMIQNPYRGNAVLEFSRYELTSVFDVIFSDIKTPTTVGALLDKISSATGIVFTEDDFDNEVIDEEEYWLEAKATSKRWVGGVKVIFNAIDMGTDISQYLISNYHDGLVTQKRMELWEAFPNDILDGLTVGKPGIGIYLRNKDHEGLVKRNVTSIDNYLTMLDHDGLVYVRKLHYSEVEDDDDFNYPNNEFGDYQF